MNVGTEYRKTRSGENALCLTVDGEGPEFRIDPSEVQALVLRATMRTGSPVFDEDLEQEALLRVLQAMRRVRDIHCPAAFMWKVVRDTVRDYWRRRRRLDHLDPEDPSLMYRPEVEVHIDSCRMNDRLRDCLNQLPVKTRMAMELFYLHEFSLIELARALGFSHSAAKMTLLRGRRELRKMLKHSVLS